MCGDPASGPLKHEYGGVSATGTLTANYTEGQEIDIKVTITAAHLGRFGFRICVIQHPTLEKTELTEACLDQHILVRVLGREAEMQHLSEPLVNLGMHAATLRPWYLTPHFFSLVFL